MESRREKKRSIQSILIKRQRKRRNKNLEHLNYVQQQTNLHRQVDVRLASDFYTVTHTEREMGE